MLFSEDLIEEVRIRNDIVSVVSSYVSLKKRGSNFIGLCPFHNERTPSFTVSSAKQMYYCFGCGVGGNVITFIMEYENYNFVEALKLLAERVGMGLPEISLSAEARKQSEYRSRLMAMNKLAATYFCRLLRSERGRVGYEYLAGRKLSDATIRYFGLGYVGKSNRDLYDYIKRQGFADEEILRSGLVKMDERYGARDKFYNRVMFPIMDANGRVIGFGGRIMGEGEPKYLNSPETDVFDKSRNLYGLNFAKATREKYVLLCEGYMDVIALHQAGYANAVAALGTAFTGLQANLLKRYTDRVNLAFDMDDAGTRAMLRAMPILKEAGISTKVVHLGPHKDPDDCIRNEGETGFRKRIEEAENGFYFEIDVLKRDFDMGDPEQKTRFFNEAAKKLLNFTEDVERNNYIEAVSRRYQIRFEDLRKLVSHHGARQMGIRREVPSPNKNRREKGEDGLRRSQKLFLTWLVEDATLYAKVKDHVRPDDFKEEPCRQVMDMLYEQFEEGGDVVPAKIINHFQDKEEQKDVASLFNARLEGELSPKEKEKAFNDIVWRIKKYSLDYEVRHSTDREALQNLIVEQTKLQKLHIFL